MQVKGCAEKNRVVSLIPWLVVILFFTMQFTAHAATVTFAIGVNVSRQAFLDSYYEYIKKVIPDLEVVYVSGSSSKVLTMIAGGIPPEMQRIGMETFQEFAASGVLEDITPLIERDHINLNDFFPSFAKAITFEGGIYSMPTNVNPSVMYWSPSQFAKYGVAPPPTRYGDPSWTWEAIRELAKKFTIDVNGDGIPDNWGVAGTPRSEVTRIGSAWGARFMDDNFQFCGNTSEMAKALEFFTGWIQNDRSITLDTKPFDQGNAALKLGDTAATLPEYHLQDKEFKVAPVPTGHIPDLYAAGIRFFKGSNVELAWEYIKPMVLEPEWVVGKAIAYGGMPSLRQAMNLYRKEVPYLDDGSWNVLLDMLNVGDIRGLDLGLKRGDVGAAIQDHVASVLEGNIAPSAALKSLSDAINAIIK
jgi:ABC-type glycerol-3-phosphate transport system substrate-binding protein